MSRVGRREVVMGRGRGRRGWVGVGVVLQVGGSASAPSDRASGDVPAEKSPD